MAETETDVRSLDRPDIEIGMGDIAVGMRIWMDTHHPVHKRGYITYADHIVLAISYYNDGSIHTWTLRPTRGGLDEHVERRRFILAKVFTPPKPQRIKTSD